MSKVAIVAKQQPNFEDRNLWEKIDCCPLCDHNCFRTVVLARDRHYGNPGLFRIVDCNECGLHFLNPLPTIEYLSKAYPTDYYAYQHVETSQQSTLKSKVRKRLRSVLRFHALQTGDPMFTTPGKMLDIGCGSGTFLAEMRQKGWDVHGVELDHQAAERGRLAGMDILAGTVNGARYPLATFDYVRSNHSFEHIHNPREVLKEIHRIVKPSGLLFIGVPNVQGLMAKFYGAYWWYLGAPVHPFGYTPTTLSRLLTEEGFEIEQVNYSSNSAGIFGSLQLYFNRNNGRMGEDGWLTRSRLLMLIGYWVARVLDFLHQGDCIEVIARRA